MATTSENIQTRQTSKDSEVVEAYVVANYGDVGLNQNYFFDILSRFIIVATVPFERIPSVYKYKDIFKLVLRPRNLWISVDGALPISGTNVIAGSLRRADAKGNVNIGDGTASTLNSSIPAITPNYTFGQKITIRKINKIIRQDDPVLFRSVFPSTMLDTHSSYTNYTEGLPDTGYITPTYEDLSKRLCLSVPMYQNTPKIPTIYTTPTSSSPGGRSYVIDTPPYTSEYAYILRLWKYQYELFMRTMIEDSTERANLLKVFTDTAYNGKRVLNSQGGYLFQPRSSASVEPYVDFTCVGWEEIAPARARIDGLDCQPLIVTTPNSFTTPQRREVGTIVYDPTYTNIVTSS